MVVEKGGEEKKKGPPLRKGKKCRTGRERGKGCESAEKLGEGGTWGINICTGRVKEGTHENDQNAQPEAKGGERHTTHTKRGSDRFRTERGK